ncbi:MAG TPA: MFS transporter, partial [Baekduia sp.]|nr:MFS transporter [Baekduia sp.]
MSDLRGLVRRPFALRMLLSALVGRLPEAMVPLALLLLARAEHGSYATAGALAGAFAVGAAIGGPLAGRAIDRLGQPTVLIAVAVLRSAALGGIVVAASSSLAVAGLLAAAAGALTPPLEPALRALWPDLAGEDEHALHAAYELDAGAQELIFVTGPLLVAVSVAAGSPATALHLTSAIGLVGTLAFALAPPARRWRGGRHAAARWTAAVRAPEVGLLLALGVLAGAAAGMVNVTATAFAERTLDNRDLAGWLLAAWAVGALAGGLTAAARRWTLSTEQRLTRLLIAFGLAFAPALLARSAPAMAAALALSGAFLAPTLACIFVLTGARAVPGAVTETFAWLTSSFLVGSAAGAAAAGTLSGDGAGVRGF